MLLYRITKKKYLNNLTGRGASFLNGARWNKAGDSVLYFAPTPSIALLEMANYIPNPRLIPENTVLGIYELPDSVPCKTLSIEQMPKDWNAFPYPVNTQNIGSKWLNSNSELCLFVPSAATPEGLENIVVVNPLHPQINQLKFKSSTSTLYNKRVFQGIDRT